MKAKIMFCVIFSVLCAKTAISQDKRAEIKEFLNQEIIIADIFAGQSITLIRERDDYFIVRKFFGSGVPVIGSVKYKVEFKSNYKIAFSEIIETSNADLTNSNEIFILAVEESGISLYLNGLKISIR